MKEQDLFKILGQNIKICRSRYNWSQAELAEKVNISINFLSELELGKKWASPTTMLKFAGIFGLEVYELLKPVTALSSASANLLAHYNHDACNLLNNLHQKYLVQFCQVK
ncbi:MAG: helix-turn-helix domain-containing protein [Candidatus Margulisbacteria bacterium]|jgi:transcriptional regulator with XRE-family HTH domain|nr:helix-turn-helix domain-containing protein [Candidatus Margulisiibacteriota bacterium]